MADLGKLYDAARAGMLNAAREWARKNKIKLDPGRLVKHVGIMLPGAIQEAGKDYLTACDAGMTAAARETFNLSIALAGVKAAKRAAGPFDVPTPGGPVTVSDPAADAIIARERAEAAARERAAADIERRHAAYAPGYGTHAEGWSEFRATSEDAAADMVSRLLAAGFKVRRAGAVVSSNAPETDIARFAFLGKKP